MSCPPRVQLAGRKKLPDVLAHSREEKEYDSASRKLSLAIIGLS
jgi:hypothetical protein